MPTTANVRLIKVIKTFIAYHPDFIQDTDGSYQMLNTGSWGVEWTIKEHDNPIYEHHTEKFLSKDEAYKFLEHIAQYESNFGPYEPVYASDDRLSRGLPIALVDPRQRIRTDAWDAVMNARKPKNDQ